MRDVEAHLRDVVAILLSVDPAVEVLDGPHLQVTDWQVGKLELSARYRDGSRLEVRLWADCRGDYPQWVSFAFPYVAVDGALRFRYDNAPHHRELPTFPYHLHRGNAVSPTHPLSARELAALIRQDLPPDIGQNSAPSA
jgi:hypothetical protein